MSEFIIISTLVVAGFIRGYTGFGFSALVILVLSSMYPVTDMVPAVLLLDLLVCLPLVSSAWNKTDFKALSPCFGRPDLAYRLAIFYCSTCRIICSRLSYLGPYSHWPHSVTAKMPCHYGYHDHLCCAGLCQAGQPAQYPPEEHPL